MPGKWFATRKHKHRDRIRIGLGYSSKTVFSTWTVLHGEHPKFSPV